MGIPSQTRTRSPRRVSGVHSIYWSHPKLTVPVGNVLVGDTGGHIEHDHTALAVDIVTISETTELLLTSSVPHVELNGTQVLQCLLVETNEWGVGWSERGFGLGWRGIRW